MRPSILKMVTFALGMLVAAGALAQDKAADEIARRSFDVMAGPAWEKARYFEFTFNVDRGKQRASSFPQRWDRATGEYRVSGSDQKHNEFVVIMNVNTRKGRAWLNGEEVEGRRLDDTLDTGYRRFLNDTYWLLMPLRMLDPGVRRTAEGERTDSCGRTWDVVKLTFGNAGLAAEDVYWAWINRDSGIVEEWDMRLQGSQPDDPPLQVMFHDFRRYAGLLISTRREIRNKNQTVRIDDLKISSDVPKGAFVK
jgi:hypothetical protein